MITYPQAPADVTSGTGVFVVANADPGDTVTLHAEKEGWSFADTVAPVEADVVVKTTVVGQSLASQIPLVRVVGAATKKINHKAGAYVFPVKGQGLFDVTVSAPWLTVEGVENGKILLTKTGSTVIRYKVEANAAHADRPAKVKIGPAEITINQTGSPCAIALPDGTKYSVDPAATQLTIKVGIPEGCTWEAAASKSTAAMFTAITPDVAGKTLTLTLAPQEQNRKKAASITITATGGKKAGIQVVRETARPKKAGARKSYEDGEIPPAKMPAAAGTKKVYVTFFDGTPGETFDWTANVVSDGDWLTLASETGTAKYNSSGVAKVTVTVRATANPRGSVRSGQLEVEGQTVEIQQAGKPCKLGTPVVKLDGTPITTFESDMGEGGEAVLSVPVPEGCTVRAYLPVSNSGWIQSDSLEGEYDENERPKTLFMPLEDEFSDDGETYLGKKAVFSVDTNERGARSVKIAVKAGTVIEKYNEEWGDVVTVFKPAATKNMILSQKQRPGWTPCRILGVSVNPLSFGEEGGSTEVAVRVAEHCDVHAETGKRTYWLSPFEALYDEEDYDDEVYGNEYDDEYDPSIIKYYSQDFEGGEDESGDFHRYATFDIEENYGKARKAVVTFIAGEYVDDVFRPASKKSVTLRQAKSTVPDEEGEW